MIGTLVGEVFDSEIVNAEAKLGPTCCVLPQAGCVRARAIAVVRELVDEVFVRKDCSLFKAVHAFFDSDVNITIGGKETVKMVLFSNGRWEILVFDTHIFWILHW